MTGQLVLITGVTGHVGFKVLVTALQFGYRVRGAVRREAQVDLIKSQASIQPFVDRLEFAIVPDITADGAFDAALKDVTYVLHVASPLPGPTDNPERDIVVPAVHGTLSMLNSAAKVPSVRRVIITSSVTAIVPMELFEKGDTTNTYTAQSRVQPTPAPPFLDPRRGYRAAKALALKAADDFLAECKPHFSIVHIMPGYVFGANELVKDAKAVASGSNALLMAMTLGNKTTDARPGTVVHVEDVARIHVGALDEKKVPNSTNFVLSINVQFEDALEITKQLFPGAVKDGRLPLGGKQPTVSLTFDTQNTIDTFGPLKSYEEQVQSVVGQYLELLAKA